MYILTMGRRAVVGFALLVGLVGHSAAAQPLPPSEWCKRVSARLASVALSVCEKSRLAPTGAVSHTGIPILMRSVPAQRGAGSKPVRVLLLGGIHGDELTSVSIVFQWLDLLSMPAAQKMHWHIAPVVNPDGLLAPEPQRMNARGVDLNRNFPTYGWERDAKSYWMKMTKSDPRRFPGESPLSEPESRWLHEEIMRFKPNVIVSVHAPFGLLDFDGPRKPPRQFGRLHLSRLGVYPGSLGNYGGSSVNVPVITIELPNARTMPAKEEVQRIWVDMTEWIERHIKHGQS